MGRVGRVAVTSVAVAAFTAAGCAGKPQPSASDIHIGRRPRSATSTVTIATAPAPPRPAHPTAHAQAVPLLDPDGRPWGAPLVFHSDVPIPDNLVFALVVGSDARPREDVRRAHGD